MGCISIDIQIIQPETPDEFEAYYHLRWQLLAKPWGQPFKISQDDKESQSYHLMAIYKQNIVGVCRLHFNTANEAQIRYMGIVDTYQRKGIATKLVKALESYAKDKHIKTIVLNAREIAIPFYVSQGYKYVEDAHIVFNIIKHVKMIKELS